MKGVSQSMMALLIAVVVLLVVVVIAFVYWEQIKVVAKSDPFAAIPALLFFKRREKPKKGLSEATNLLILVVMVLAVAFIMILIYLSLAAESGPASSNLFYDIFDAIIRQLPWVS